MNLKEGNCDVKCHAMNHEMWLGCSMVMNSDMKYRMVKIDRSIVILWVKSGVCRSVNCSLEMEGEGHNRK